MKSIAAKGHGRGVRVDLNTIRSIDHECTGCSGLRNCCCARYDVCVGRAEMKRIVGFLPEAARLCPGLGKDKRYANVFEKTADGLFAIDTDEKGLCVFAYKSRGLVRCSLHTVEKERGMPMGSIKPAVCLLWPLTYSEDGRTLTLTSEALSYPCCSRRKKPSRTISPALASTISRAK